jgi:hypothetical protein
MTCSIQPSQLEPNVVLAVLLYLSEEERQKSVFKRRGNVTLLSTPVVLIFFDEKERYNIIEYNVTLEHTSHEEAIQPNAIDRKNNIDNNNE